MVHIVYLVIGFAIGCSMLGSIPASAEEWKSPRWCGPERIPALIKEYGPNEDAYTQYVFIGDALKAMGCLPLNVNPNNRVRHSGD